LAGIKDIKCYWRSRGVSEYLEKAVKDTALSLGNPTLSELVDMLVKDRGLKFKDATKTVYVMWKKGELELAETNPPSKLSSYVFHLENLWFWALTALVAFTVLVVFAVNNSPLLYVRYVLGGIFILFLPGAMLIAALYPKEGELDGLERLALSIGLSLAIVPLVGLALNYTPWGITLTPIMLSLAFFAEVMGVAAFVKKFRYYKLANQLK
jgi:uncharacterized membrane protein